MKWQARYRRIATCLLLASLVACCLLFAGVLPASSRHGDMPAPNMLTFVVTLATPLLVLAGLIFGVKSRSGLLIASYFVCAPVIALGASQLSYRYLYQAMYEKPYDVHFYSKMGMFDTSDPIYQSIWISEPRRLTGQPPNAIFFQLPKDGRIISVSELVTAVNSNGPKDSFGLESVPGCRLHFSHEGNLFGLRLTAVDQPGSTCLRVSSNREGPFHALPLSRPQLEGLFGPPSRVDVNKTRFHMVNGTTSGLIPVRTELSPDDSELRDRRPRSSSKIASGKQADSTVPATDSTDSTVPATATTVPATDARRPPSDSQPRQPVKRSGESVSHPDRSATVSSVVDSDEPQQRSTNSDAARSRSNQPKLYSAVSKGDTATVRQLLQTDPQLAKLKFAGRHKNHPLHIAAEKGRIEIIQMLIQQGADVNVRNRYGSTPLHRAADRGRLEAIELLLDSGADAEAKNNRGVLPVTKAKMSSHKTAARLIQNHQVAD